jgi:putative ABC transport system permease protein
MVRVSPRDESIHRERRAVPLAPEAGLAARQFSHTSLIVLDAITQDLRYALRTLSKSPGFGAVTILSLALGIGANTAIFSLIDVVILKSLPVPHPEELLQVMMARGDYSAFTNPTWEHLRDRQDVFSGVFAYARWGFNLATGGQARSVNGNYVSGQYFDTLGVHAILGRTLTAADDTRGCTGAAILSYGFWQSEYGGRADILGKPISIDRHPIQIVGVAEPGFNGAEVGGSADVMLPLCAVAVIGSGYPNMLDMNSYPVGWLQVMGRLKRGVSASQATARLKILAPRIYQSAFDQRGLITESGHPVRPEWREEYLHRTLDTYPAANGISYLRREYSRALAFLMTIVGVVLLIACANVANLLLARGAGRQREIAIRMAVGAGRSRLIRQLLTESLLLSGSGAALGILLADLGARLLIRFLDVPLDPAVDVRVLSFTACIAVLTSLLFGVAPAWRGTRVDSQSALKASSRGVLEGSKLELGKALVAAQVALSFFLVVGAGLMLRTFWKLFSLDPGFEREHVLLVNVDLRNYPAARQSTVYQQILEQLRTIPSLRSASVSSVAPICHCRFALEVAVDGHAPISREDALVSFNSVSDRYFETLGTSMVRGRDFNSHDTFTSTKVAIVNESMAAKYFGAENPLGRHFRIWSGSGEGPGTAVEIVGEVKNAKYGSMRDEPAPVVFLPWSQGGPPGPLTGFQLRAAAAPKGLIRGALSAIGRVDPDVSIQFKTLADKVDDSIQRETLLAMLAGFFGGLALVLSAVGLYGVISYNVARRRNEIGIRVALGASRSRVLWTLFGEVAILLTVGLAIGFGAALAATRLVASFLYGVQPNDPLTLGVASVMLVLVAVIAGYLPARRACSLDPMAALREE